MWRILLEPAVFFLSPFIIYILVLLLQRVAPFTIARWTKSIVFSLVLTGLATAVLAVFLFGILAERYKGTYVPAHIENGRLVPGQLR
jgi:hypothetical protein